MNDFLDDDILQIFLDEAEESLDEWERAVLSLEDDPDPEDFNALFRSAHNIKGASRAVGLDNLGTFVHAVEDVINSLRTGDLVITPDVVEVLLQYHSTLAKWIGELRDSADASLFRQDLLTRIKLTWAKQGVPRASKETEDAEVSKETEPEKPEASKPQEVPAESSETATEEEDLEAIFMQAKAEYDSQAETAAVEETSEVSEEEDLEAIFMQAKAEYDNEQKEIAEKTSEEKAEKPTQTKEPEDPTPSESPKAKEAKEVEKPKKPAKKGGSKSKKAANDTIRIGANKLDELIQLIGELSIHQSIVYQGKRSFGQQDKTIRNAINLSYKITKELHQKALGLRMQPLQGLFQRLERTARDVARSQRKKVQIVLEGSEVELDKTVIERVSDPLMHIMRNAIDHGLEHEEDRAAAGKQGTATVTLRASQDPAGVKLEVVDNGKGLDAARVLKKAVERGLVDENDSLTDKQIHNLIFHSGLSTAENVTDISGRGVGMDVVMSAVKALKGSIEVESEKGVGSTFSILLPLSLSIIDALVVEVNTLRYAVPMQELTEIIDLSNYEITTSGEDGQMISFRGDVVPVRDLRGTLETRTSEDMGDNRGPALIVREGEGLIAFRIDEIVNQQQIVVRQMSKNLTGLDEFQGCTILSDGEPGMIVNLSNLARGHFDAARMN